MITEELKRLFNAIGSVIQAIPTIGQAINAMASGMSDSQADVVEPKPKSTPTTSEMPSWLLATAAPRQSSSSPVPSSGSSAPFDLPEVVREAFRNKGAMTVNDLVGYLQRRGIYSQLVAQYGPREATTKIQRTVYDQRKEGYLHHPDRKSSTPWMPTAKLLSRNRNTHVRPETADAAIPSDVLTRQNPVPDSTCRTAARPSSQGTGDRHSSDLNTDAEVAEVA